MNDVFACSCTKCTDSEYPCKWCIKHHICTNHATSSETCDDDIMVTGRQVRRVICLLNITKAKAGMVYSVSGCTLGVQVKLWDTLRLHAIPEHLRSVITTRCYTNPRLPLPYLYLYHPLIICFAKCSRYTCDMVYSLQIQLAVEQTCWMLVQFWGPICRKS